MKRSLSIMSLFVLAFLPVVELAAQLPAEAGQVWQTYDIGAFVEVAGQGSQKHVVDWVLQETGYEAWHGETVASLTATTAALRVFHAPDMQARVAEIVKRFTVDAQSPHRFAVRVLGIGSPAWRADMRGAMQPIAAATPGVNAWILSREAAAMLVGQLKARADCEELPTGITLAANGVPAVLAGGRTRPYVKDVAVRPDVWPGWTRLDATCGEGFELDVQPLITTDGTAIEAVVRCRIDQIERMAPVSVTVPAADRQRVQIEVPQMSAVRIGERFRWPANQCLVIGLGLVPWPVPGQNTASTAALLTDAKRTDVIVVVEPRLADGP
jgi:hypothetical protein